MALRHWRPLPGALAALKDVSPKRPHHFCDTDQISLFLLTIGRLIAHARVASLPQRRVPLCLMHKSLFATTWIAASTLLACGFRLEAGGSTSSLTVVVPARDAGATDAQVGEANVLVNGVLASFADEPGLPYAYARSGYARRCSGLVMAPKDVNALATRVNFQFRQSGSPDALLQAITGCVVSLSSVCGEPSPSCQFNQMRGSGATLSECQVASECQSGVCSALADTCGLCVDPIPLGAACSPENDFCGPQRLCDASGICVARSVKSVGQPCKIAGASCDTGMVCGGGGRCIRPQLVGAACMADIDCDEGGNVYCTSSATGRQCGPRPAIGASCKETACASGLACDAATLQCRAAQVGVATGLGCDVVDQCETGSTCRIAGGWRACLPELAIDQACISDAECAGDNIVCSQGVCGALTSACKQ